jgi:hypothetical protein
MKTLLFGTYAGFKQSGQRNSSGCTFEEVDNIDMRKMCFLAYQEHVGYL